MTSAKPQIQTPNLESRTLFYRSWSVKAYTLLLLVPILYPDRVPRKKSLSLPPIKSAS